jgi:hypothetical protein
MVLGQLAVLEKMGANYEQLLRAFFSCFVGKKKFEILKKILLHMH